MIDLLGCPEFFVNEIGAIEDAGDGLIRIVRGIRRGEEFIPVFSFVTPVSKFIEVRTRVQALAQKIADGEYRRH